MRKALVFTYGLLAYAIFLGTFVYAVGFIGNLGVPKAIDAVPTVPWAQAILIDLALLTVFALQHSLMARPAFKRWWTQWVPKPAERSTYVLFSSLALIALFAFWQPIGGVIWTIEDPLGYAVLYALFAFGWALVLVSTFLINHFDLFGLRQVWLYLRGQPYTPLRFATPVLYRHVRHPLYVGWFFAFWATPTMTVTHFLFAVVTTLYILVAVRWEERDLVSEHGEAYTAYRRRVPRFIPRLAKPGPREGAALPQTRAA